MIDRTHALPITRQAQIVNISRGSVYYQSEPISDADLKLMRHIDELHLELPFAGARMLRDLLRAEGFAVGRKHMTTLMRRMGITALYRKPNTSKRAPGHTIYPYLLRTLTITRSNHVWAMDISYIPMARGFVYLAAVIDWHSRRVLAWRLSISMDTAFCTEAVERGDREVRQAGDLQHQPGQSVHEQRVHRLAARTRHPRLDGRQGLLA